MTTETKRKVVWQKGGKSPNPAGRPKGTGKPISRLRSTLNKLKNIEPEAIEVIESAVLGKEVDKTQLDTSKWVITSISTLTRAALAEESHKIELDALQQQKNLANGTTGTSQPAKFSMKMIPVEDE